GSAAERTQESRRAQSRKGGKGTTSDSFRHREAEPEHDAEPVADDAVDVVIEFEARAGALGELVAEARDVTEAGRVAVLAELVIPLPKRCAAGDDVTRLEHAFGEDVCADAVSALAEEAVAAKADLPVAPLVCSREVAADVELVVAVGVDRW